MKHILPTLTCLLLAATAPLMAQTKLDSKKLAEEATRKLSESRGKDDGKPGDKPDGKPKRPAKRVPYVIMVPPATPIPGLNPHEHTRTLLIGWASEPAQAALFPPNPPNPPFEFNLQKEVDLPLANGNVFTASLTPAQATAIANHFKFIVDVPHEYKPTETTSATPAAKAAVAEDAKKVRPASVSSGSPPTGEAIMKQKEKEIKMGPVIKHPDGIQPNLTAPQTTWAQSQVITGDITRDSLRRPVLYVVDTGVQPFIGTTSTWHPEFAAALTTPTGAPTLRIRQGRVPSSLASWPKLSPSNGSVWHKTPREAIIVPTATTSPPSPTFTGTTYLDPHKDVVGHGTKITSAAIGANVGLLGKVKTGSTQLPLDIESIRIYNSTSTFTVDAIGGIYLAVDSHLRRVNGAAASTGYAAVTADPTSASVLLFASRTFASPYYDPNLEVALLWAWQKGMVVVVAGGNDPSAYNSPNLPAKHGPDPIWYAAYNVLPTGPLPTSPSRFNWAEPANNIPSRAFWPPWTGKPSAGADCPLDPYLIVVGGSGNPTSSDWSPTSSRGPGIDIIAPGQQVAAALTAGSGDYLGLVDGTSLSTGYVAGAAVAYVASTSVPTLPMTWGTKFRNWLLPNSTPPTSAPIQATSAARVGQGATGSAPKLYLVPSVTSW